MNQPFLYVSRAPDDLKTIFFACHLMSYSNWSCRKNCLGGLQVVSESKYTDNVCPCHNAYFLNSNTWQSQKSAWTWVEERPELENLWTKLSCWNVHSSRWVTQTLKNILSVGSPRNKGPRIELWFGGWAFTFLIRARRKFIMSLHKLNKILLHSSLFSLS